LDEKDSQNFGNTPVTAVNGSQLSPVQESPTSKGPTDGTGGKPTKGQPPLPQGGINSVEQFMLQRSLWD